MRLAIVGSQLFHESWKYNVVDAMIKTFLIHQEPDVVISGGCKTGVDRSAELLGKWYGYSEEDGTLIIHRPNNDQWEPNGFKKRNIMIAEDCTHMLCIRDKGSTTYGSGWTANYADNLGRHVWKFEL